MKLIATLGTTKPKNLHTYYIENKKYEKPFSFLALKDYFNIDDNDVIIIGTKDTKEEQEKYIKNFQFVEVNADNFREVFEKTINSIENDSIVDLTQSFKSLGYGALLSYFYSKSIGKKVKDIFYAQVQENCNPGVQNCTFVFQSLKEYEEIVELVREINVFLDSWYVIKQEKEEDFKIIHNNLLEISNKLLLNDLDVLDNIEEINKEIDRLYSVEEENVGGDGNTRKTYGFLFNHLNSLQEELNNIKSTLLLSEESKKMFTFAKLFLKKNLLLQSITILFEAIGAYVEEKTENNFKCKKGEKIYTKNDDKYKFRNCIKSKLSVVRYNKQIPNYLRKIIMINDLENFAKHYMLVDELRNNSAHVFINGKVNKHASLKEKLEEEISFFEKYF